METSCAFLLARQLPPGLYHHVPSGVQGFSGEGGVGRQQETQGPW